MPHKFSSDIWIQRAISGSTVPDSLRWTTSGVPIRNHPKRSAIAVNVSASFAGATMCHDGPWPRVHLNEQTKWKFIFKIILDGIDITKSQKGDYASIRAESHIFKFKPAIKYLGLEIFVKVNFNRRMQ